MKVALLLERFDRDGGGLEQWAWRLAHALADRGHSIAVLAFHAAATPASQKIALRLLPWHPSRIERARVADAAIVGTRFEVSHDLGIATAADLLHPQSGGRLANERREQDAWSTTRRLLMAIDPRRRRWLAEVRQFEELRYRRNRTSLVVAVSRMVAEDLRAWHGVPPERIRLIPNGINTVRYHPPAVQERERWRRHFGFEGRTVFLFAAQNPRLKGLATLLEAFATARVGRPDLRLAAIGKAPDRDTLRAIHRLALVDAVVFAGRVPDPSPYYAAADAFVLPSWHDACSLTVLEACACGLPVITTRANGAAERLIDGREGRILPIPGDPAALAAALVELSSPEIRARMAAAAIACTARNTFARNVEALEKLYAEVAAVGVRDDPMPPCAGTLP
jgi:UDP-glucose:(heptosyl)LPS alpha-1,3-glucosyltransferase